MRTLPSATQRALAKPWVAAPALLDATLYRDRFGAVPSSLTVRLSDRVRYRPRTTILDAFDRADSADVGSEYTPGSGSGANGTFAGLRITSQRVRLAAVTDQDLRYEGHGLPVGQDHWARITVPSWTPGAGRYIQAGVLVRVDAAAHDWYECGIGNDDNGAWAAVFIARRAGGAAPSLTAELPYAAVPGETFYVVAHGARITLYHATGTPLVVLDDPTPLLHGFIGLHAYVSSAGGGAVGHVELDDFAGGPWREEYLDVALGWGPLSQTLGAVVPTGNPATLDVPISNLVPVGGKARFSDLIRHGLQVGAGTYDHPLAELALAVAPEGAGVDPPLSLARLLLDDVAELDERTGRLRASGRDAFLDTLAEAGVVGDGIEGTWVDDSSFEVQEACDGSIDDPSEPMFLYDPPVSPFNATLLNQYDQLCAPPHESKITLFAKATQAVFRDRVRYPGTLVSFHVWANFSQKNNGSWIDVNQLTLQLVVFEPPASQAELTGYRSGYVGEAAGPRIKTVLAELPFDGTISAGSHPTHQTLTFEVGDEPFVGAVLALPNIGLIGGGVFAVYVEVDLELAFHQPGETVTWDH